MSTRKTVTDNLETEKSDEEQKVAPVQQKAEEKEPVIYIGPTIPGVARNNQVFTEGVIPETLSDKRKKIPAIEGLIIGVSKLAEAEQQIRKENTVLNVFYKAVEADIKKGE